MKNVFLSMILVTFGCSESIDFVVDSRCSTMEKALIYKAINEINKSGVTEEDIWVFDTKEQYSETSENEEIIFCLPGRQESLGHPEYALAYSENKNIYLFYQATPENKQKWINTFKHEVGHCLGFVDNYTDPDSFMYYKSVKEQPSHY